MNIELSFTDRAKKSLRGRVLFWDDDTHVLPCTGDFIEFDNLKFKIISRTFSLYQEWRPILLNVLLDTEVD